MATFQRFIRTKVFCPDCQSPRIVFNGNDIRSRNGPARLLRCRACGRSFRRTYAPAVGMVRDPTNLLCPACQRRTRKTGRIVLRTYECTHCQITFRPNTMHLVVARLRQRDFESRSYCGSSLALAVRHYALEEDAERIEAVGEPMRQDHKQVSPEVLKRVERLRADGMSVVALSKRCGTSQSTMRRWLKIGGKREAYYKGGHENKNCDTDDSQRPKVRFERDYNCRDDEYTPTPRTYFVAGSF